MIEALALEEAVADDVAVTVGDAVCVPEFVLLSLLVAVAAAAREAAKVTAVTAAKEIKSPR